MPPPETGAVDTGGIAKHICHSFRKWELSGAGSHLHVYEALKPLSERIAQLENENERLDEFELKYLAAKVQLEPVKAALESANYMGNLLAIIHRDGGHYRAEHGDKKATDDAIEIVGELKRKMDRLESCAADLRDAATTLIRHKNHNDENLWSNLANAANRASAVLGSPGR